MIHPQPPYLLAVIEPPVRHTLIRVESFNAVDIRDQMLIEVRVRECETNRLGTLYTLPHQYRLLREPTLNVNANRVLWDNEWSD